MRQARGSVKRDARGKLEDRETGYRRRLGDRL